MEKKNNKIPVCSFLISTLIIIFSLSVSSLLKINVCNKDFLSSLINNFIHLEFYHLITNTYSLYVLSRVEEEIGSKNFLLLIIFSLVCNTILETILYKLNKNIKCSIGFSGILFTILVFEILTKNKIDIQIILSIVVSVILPNIYSSKVSFTGHLIGVMSGILSAYLYKNRFLLAI